MDSNSVSFWNTGFRISPLKQAGSKVTNNFSFGILLGYPKHVVRISLNSIDLVALTPQWQATSASNYSSTTRTWPHEVHCNGIATEVCKFVPHSSFSFGNRGFGRKPAFPVFFFWGGGWKNNITTHYTAVSQVDSSLPCYWVGGRCTQL